MIDRLKKWICYLLLSAKLDPGTARFTFGVFEGSIFASVIHKKSVQYNWIMEQNNSVKEIKRAPVRWVAVRVERLWAFCSARLSGRAVSKLKKMFCPLHLH